MSVDETKYLITDMTDNITELFSTFYNILNYYKYILFNCTVHYLGLGKKNIGKCFLYNVYLTEYFGVEIEMTETIQIMKDC